MSLRVRLGLGCVALSCMAAFLWVPSLQHASRGFFLPDMVLSLGLSLAAALILCELMPDAIVPAA